MDDMDVDPPASSVNESCTTLTTSADSASSSAADVSQGRTESLAQSLPYDVVLEIAREAATSTCDQLEGELIAWPVTSVCETIHHLPLVCRAWKDAGQAYIFRGIVFATRRQCEGFLKTVKERPELADQVRAVSVGRLLGHPAQRDDPAEDEDWESLSALMLECLSLCKQCQHLQVAPLHPSLAAQVFETIRSLPLPLRSLILRIYDAHQDLSPQECVEFYQYCFDLFGRLPLTHFEINFRPPYLPTRQEVFVPVLPVSPITSYHSTVNSVEAFLQSLRMMPHLKILTAYTEWAFDPAIAGPIFGALKDLEELRVESNIPASNVAGSGGNPAGSDNFWLNKLLPSYSKLRLLSVTEQDALPCQFNEPPPSLELLEFVHFGPNPAQRFYDFRDLLETGRVDGHFAAREFVFVADEEAFLRTVKQEDVQILVDEYKDKGVRFRVEFEIMEMPQRRYVEI
ncbi:hypothetical protein JCM8547_008523 [Rhodosporidiobolus lusitaniae]